MFPSLRRTASSPHYQPAAEIRWLEDDEPFRSFWDCLHSGSVLISGSVDIDANAIYRYIERVYAWWFPLKLRAKRTVSQPASFRG